MQVTGTPDRYPLSPLQYGMLYHYLSEPESGTDIEQMVCTLTEALDLPLLQRAWESIVERHPMLRTQFEFAENGDPVHVVREGVTLPWQVLDWRDMNGQNKSEGLSDFLKRDRTRGFEMSAAPLLRLTCIRLGESEYQLVWTFHHILLDGRSFPIVLSEVFDTYDGLRRDQSVVLKPRRPYSDYIHWLQTQDFSEAETYWRNQLQGITSPTHLLVEKTRESQSEDEGSQGEESSTLSEYATAGLDALARENGLTLNTIVQGAWAMLLNRYSGEDDVIFGVVRACRKSSIEGAEDILGLFINTLPLRLHVPQDVPVIDWLRDVRREWMGMREYEHTPLVEVQKCSSLPSTARLFDSILMFEKYELNELLKRQGGSWENREFRYYEQTGYPITVTAFSGTRLYIKIEYDRLQFERAAILRMLNHFKQILESILASPTQTTGTVSMLTPHERQQLTVEWNDTRRDYPRGATIHQLFEEQVRKAPQSIAVTFENQELTYEELNARANQLAHHLRDLGVRTDSLVGICLERSLEMVVAVLAVLKSGVAYVPLDPAFPKERLALILEDAHAEVLLTQRTLLPVLTVTREKVLYLEELDLRSLSSEKPEEIANADDLAYVIFTSGSTGRPKGVQIEHRAVVNFLESMAREPGLSASDVLVAVTTLSFDIAGLELFLPLTRGARVVVASRAIAIDGKGLAKLLETSSATVMQGTPATWRLLLESGWTGRASLKILCGGEAMPPELAKELLLRSSSLWNVYGPTETTIWSTLWQVQSPENPIPIGHAIANTTLYLLDRHMRPVPVGVPGELYIGGDGLARGYLNQSELTAQKFILNPFDHSGTTRLYGTGDLCRWRSDGSMECLGRNDFQVKIRGYRIELGDIEAALESHSAVKQAVVTMRDNAAGDKMLVAFLTSHIEEAIDADEIRDYLVRRLPDYMVPATYVMLKELPLTPNGKVDRKALPKVESIPTKASSSWSAPDTKAEERVAAIWEEALGVNKVGRDSNFFDLGGHSLLVVRVCKKLEESFEKEIAVVEFFRNPTVRSLAKFLSGQGEDLSSLSRSPEQIAMARKAARQLKQRRTLEGQRR